MVLRLLMEITTSSVYWRRIVFPVRYEHVTYEKKFMLHRISFCVYEVLLMCSILR
jgi:hypothetical protein